MLKTPDSAASHMSLSVGLAQSTPSNCFEPNIVNDVESFRSSLVNSSVSGTFCTCAATPGCPPDILLDVPTFSACALTSAVGCHAWVKCTAHRVHKHDANAAYTDLSTDRICGRASSRNAWQRVDVRGECLDIAARGLWGMLL